MCLVCLGSLLGEQFVQETVFIDVLGHFKLFTVFKNSGHMNEIGFQCNFVPMT